MGYSLAVAAEACSADYPSGSAAVEATASCPERYSGPAAAVEDASCLACQATAEAFGVEQPVHPLAVAEPSSWGCRDEGHRSGRAFHTAAASVGLA